MFSFAMAVLAVALWATNVWAFVTGNKRTNRTNTPLPVVDLGYKSQRATTINVGSIFNSHAGHSIANLSHKAVWGIL